MKLYRLSFSVLLAASLCFCLPAISSAQQPSTAPIQPGDSSASPALDLQPDAHGMLSQEQMQRLLRVTADHDLENDKRQRDYTYVEREEQRTIDSKGRIKKTEVRTSEVLEIYGEQVERLISKDDKPLSPKDAEKEDKKIQKIIDKRQHESEKERQKRLAKEEKDREDGRKFLSQVADAYTFHFVGAETVDGRETYVIDADPRPGFQPKMKYADVLPKFRFRAWIDKNDLQWRKLDAVCIDTVSFGLFLARIHKGTRVVFDQARVNDEVWLPRHMTLKVDARVALLKTFNLDLDTTYSDYKKFRTDTKILGMGETHQ